jgi:predicted methyltransferase
MARFYNRIISGLVLALALTALWGQGAAFAGDEAAMRAKLEKIVAGGHRSPVHKARDRYRHPVETLIWFGLRDDMTVVEISPGGGWYTEILAPFLKDRGVFYAAGYDPASWTPYYRHGAKKFAEKLAANPAAYGKVKVTVMAKGSYDIAPKGSADMVLTFRNVHNWMDGDYAAAAFKAFYDTLKPGGVLGLVEHRGDPAMAQDEDAEAGYVREDTAIKFARKAGFKLVGKSEINANPKDNRDHPKGVWTLPPSLRLKDKDREKYLAIGESDRMTLKFIKPVI